MACVLQSTLTIDSLSFRMVLSLVLHCICRTRLFIIIDMRVRSCARAHSHKHTHRHTLAHHNGLQCALKVFLSHPHRYLLIFSALAPCLSLSLFLFSSLFLSHSSLFSLNLELHFIPHAIVDDCLLLLLLLLLFYFTIGFNLTLFSFVSMIHLAYLFLLFYSQFWSPNTSIMFIIITSQK